MGKNWIEINERFEEGIKPASAAIAVNYYKASDDMSSFEGEPAFERDASGVFGQKGARRRDAKGVFGRRGRCLSGISAPFARVGPPEAAPWCAPLIAQATRTITSVPIVREAGICRAAGELPAAESPS